MDNIGSATNSPNWPEKRLTIPPCFSNIYGCDRKKSHSSARKLFYTHTDLKLDTDIHGGKIKNWYCFKMTSKISYFQQWIFNNHFRIVHYKMHLWIPSYTYVKMAVLFVVMASSLTNVSDISDMFAACTRTLWWWRQQATLKRWHL